MFSNINIDLKSKTVRNAIIGTIGAVLAAYAGETSWVAAAGVIWMLIQNVHVRSRTVQAEDTLLSANAELQAQLNELRDMVKITPEMAVKALEGDGEV